MNPISMLAVLIMVFIMPGLGLAQHEPLPMESDWMEFVKGHRDARTGTEVREISTQDGEDFHSVTLAIPKQSVSSPDSIEEVVVVGRMPEKPQPLPKVRYEWLDDLDPDNYGLLIRVPKDTKWPIRLYMASEEGFIRQ